MDTISYQVVGDPNQIRTDVERALAGAGLSCTWTDAWTGVGKRGNPVANFFGGWMAQYVRIDVQLRSQPDGSTRVHLQCSTGAMGGLPGQRKVQKTFGAVLLALETALADRSVLVAG